MDCHNPTGRVGNPGMAEVVFGVAGIPTDRVARPEQPAMTTSFRHPRGANSEGGM